MYKIANEIILPNHPSFKSSKKFAQNILRRAGYVFKKGKQIQILIKDIEERIQKYLLQVKKMKLDIEVFKCYEKQTK